KLVQDCSVIIWTPVHWHTRHPCPGSAIIEKSVNRVSQRLVELVKITKGGLELFPTRDQPRFASGGLLVQQWDQIHDGFTVLVDFGVAVLIYGLPFHRDFFHDGFTVFVLFGVAVLIYGWLLLGLELPRLLGHFRHIAGGTNNSGGVRADAGDWFQA